MKKNMKKGTVLLAAASIAGFGTFTATATPAGDMISDLFKENECQYVKGASDIHSDSDKVNVEVLDINGDNNSAVGTIRLTNKDGSSFADDDCFIDYSHDDKVSAERKHYYIDKFLGNQTSEPVVGTQFSLEDGNSVIISFRYVSTNNGCPIGETLEMSCHSLSAVHPIKTVFTPVKNDENAGKFIDVDGYSSWYFTENIYNTLESEYSKEISEGYILRPSEDGNSIILAKEKKLYLDFSLRLTFSYQTEEGKVFNTNNASVAGVEWNTDPIQVNPASLRLHTVTSQADKLSIPAEPDYNSYIISDDGTSQEVSDEYLTLCGLRQIKINSFYSELELKLSDGRTITAKKADLGECGNTNVLANTLEIDSPYFYFENGKPTTIDPADVITISVDGITLNS